MLGIQSIKKTKLIENVFKKKKIPGSMILRPE